MNTFGAVTERLGQEDLEKENARLQKLVAELLARNQQLRQALELATRTQVAGGDWR
jgi:molybdopterin converting factor small subunit